MATATNVPARQQQAGAVQQSGGLGQLQSLLDKYKGQIAVALPKHMTPERMIRVALTAVSQNPRLMECNPYTVCGAIVQSSILGLEPNSNLGEAFLVPYWNKKANNGRGGYDCQLQIGYKGHVKLARNSGELAMVDAQPVFENDDFEFEKGDAPYLKHKWGKKGERGELIGYWAGFKTKDGTFNFEYWTIVQIYEHRDRYTKSKDRNGEVYGPWIDNPDWMCRKTVLIQVLKLAPKSVQLATAIGVDETPHGAFSIDVPLELQPAREDEEPPAIDAPKRKSDSAQAADPAPTAESIPEFATWPSVGTDAGDRVRPELGLKIIVAGAIYERNALDDSWQKAK